MSKRSHLTAFDDGPRLRIKLASTGEAGAGAASPLEADAQVIRLFSSVARQLPETDEWDLSGLLVDGQPVSRAIVVAWLNAAYQHAYDADYKQQQDSPARSFEGLYSLLCFADAVGSTKPLFRACCAGLEQLQLKLQLAQQLVSLETDGRCYTLGCDGDLLGYFDMCTPSTAVPGVSIADGAEQESLIQQVAAQTEQLLWLAYRLQLEPLVQHLHRFIRGQGWFASSLMADTYENVFTARVVEAAGVAALPGGRQMLMNHVTGELAAMVNDVANVSTFLEPQGLTFEQQQALTIKFNAVVRHTGLQLPVGATIPVELNLLGNSTIRLGRHSYLVQLRINSDPCA